MTSYALTPAEEKARTTFAAVMLCLDAGNPVGAEARIWEALVHYAEPVEKERDEAKEGARHRHTTGRSAAERLASLKLNAPRAWSEGCMDVATGDLDGILRDLSEAREENTRLREQLDALKSDEWLRAAASDDDTIPRFGWSGYTEEEIRAEIVALFRTHRDCALEPRPPLRDDGIEG